MKFVSPSPRGVRHAGVQNGVSGCFLIDVFEVVADKESDV